MDPYNHSTPISIKLLILNTGKFKQWKFRIQQYLQHKHYALWEVIEFGDSYKAPPEETAKDKGLAREVSASTKKKGRTVAITAKDMKKRKNDAKARTTLLLALPDEHQLRFNKYDTAKELWEAILKTFEVFATLAPEWLVYITVWRNRDDLDTMSLDDVYNHLKVYEPEVQNRARSNSQNMASISSSNTNSGKSKVPTVQGVYTFSAQVSTNSTDVVAASLSYDTVCAFIATQPNGSQIKYEKISQIDDDDIEEMDIKWNLALLSMRADKFWKKTGKKITIQGSDVAGFNKSKVECFKCYKMGYFAKKCRSLRSQDRGNRESYKKDPKVEEPAPMAMIAIDGIGWDWSDKAEEDEASKNHALVVVEEEVPTKYALMAKSSSSSDNEVYDDFFCSKSCRKKTENLNTKISKLNEELNLDRLLGSQKLDKDKKGVGFNEYYVVPPPPAQVYSPPKKDLSWMGLPEFVDHTVTDYIRPTPIIDVSKSVSKELEKSWKSNNPSFFKQGGSSGNVVSYPMIKFEKESGCSNATKVNNAEHARKPTVKYAEMVLVIKPHNKTPCELFNERSPAIGFLRAFRCHVMIFNTLDHLGKFDAKGDKGYFIRYSLSSKAFRAFNKRTKKIEENLHVDFLENRSIEKGTAVKEKESPLRFIALPNWFHEAQMATSNEAAKKDVKAEVPTVNTPVPTGSLSVPPITSSVPRIISIGGSSYPEPLPLGNAMSFKNRLEDFFGDTSDAVSLNHVEADLSNMETC
uniref:Retroviral polymerase SH3-like domain-containing protein n=1 Tax=Tanacetum cinerariifolium TaxID=118510 RepID=A0A699H223_TANCI|nr:hypothetical protein [Tanacetum cinerariifolium]